MSLRETLDPRSSLWTLLACQLWWHRTERGLSCADVARLTNCVRQTVSNWEAGRIRIAEDQARKLDREWRTGGLFELLLWFARTAHDPDWFAQYVQYEVAASSIKIYHGQFIPSLLQTPDYARVFLAGDVDDVEAAVAPLTSGIGVRDSKNPHAEHHTLTPTAFTDLVHRIKQHDLDL